MSGEGELPDRADELPEVSADAAAAYAAAGDAMKVRVDEAIDRDESLSDLDDPTRRLLADNHANHARFMAQVLQANEPRLLARILPWVYRTYHAHGVPYEYFPLELRAWKAALIAELEPDRARELLPWYDWMLTEHPRIVRMAEAGEDGSPSPDRHGDDRAEPFLEALLEGDRHGFLELLEQSVAGPDDLAEVYLHGIRPAMYRIGDLWSKGEITIAQEHLATSIVARGLAHVYERHHPPESDKGSAVVTPAPGETHEIGARMVADLLDVDGWDVTYMGARTPVPEVVARLEESKACLLAISLVMPFHVHATRQLIDAARRSARGDDLLVLVGGRAFAAIPELEALVGADASPATPEELLSVARDAWHDRTATEARTDV